MMKSPKKILLLNINNQKNPKVLEEEHDIEHVEDDPSLINDNKEQHVEGEKIVNKFEEEEEEW